MKNIRKSHRLFIFPTMIIILLSIILLIMHRPQSVTSLHQRPGLLVQVMLVQLSWKIKTFQKVYLALILEMHTKFQAHSWIRNFFFGRKRKVPTSLLSIDSKGWFLNLLCNSKNSTIGSKRNYFYKFYPHDFRYDVILTQDHPHSYISNSLLENLMNQSTPVWMKLGQMKKARQNRRFQFSAVEINLGVVEEVFKILK